VLTVDGRDIHHFLGVGRDYTNWIKAQIRRAHLVENIDYIVYAQKGVNPHGGRPSNEYFFTFEAAKHICMQSDTEKGHAIRRYFLECEAKWQQSKAQLGEEDFPDLMAISALVRAVADNRRQIAALEAETAKANASADEANANAQLAIRGQQWLTIHQYVTIHRLQRQMPLALQQQYGRWLTGLCRERGIRVYVQRSQEYAEENTYWISTIEETLPGWLNRRHGQTGLGLA
jgi:phage anti-repressor protein